MRLRSKILSFSVAAIATILITRPKVREQIINDIEEYGKVFSDAIEQGRQAATSKKQELQKEIDTK